MEENKSFIASKSFSRLFVTLFRHWLLLVMRNPRWNNTWAGVYFSSEMVLEMNFMVLYRVCWVKSTYDALQAWGYESQQRRKQNSDRKLYKTLLFGCLPQPPAFLENLTNLSSTFSRDWIGFWKEEDERDRSRIGRGHWIENFTTIMHKKHFNNPQNEIFFQSLPLSFLLV